jgi:hypothetical protein
MGLQMKIARMLSDNLRRHFAISSKGDHDLPLRVAKMAGYAFGSNPPYNVYELKLPDIERLFGRK